MKQLPLELPFRQVAGRADFIVSDCNALAVASIDQWPDWRGSCRALNLVGPPGAGKSHLAAIWQSLIVSSHHFVTLEARQIPPEPTFYVFDNIDANDKWNEEALFHFFNRCAADQGGSLLLSQTPVGQMNWQLPDLRSRMRAVNMARIDLPDDDLLYGLLDKYFADRQMLASPSLLAYLVGHMERSFNAVQSIASELDRRSMAERKPLSVSLARAMFDELP
jgi:chromosomal replication initiation ATPase DnaA